MQVKKMMCVLIAFLAVVSYANAQPGFNEGVDDVGAPIPGLLLAAIAGLVIGVRKIYPKK
jgi:hypothetical protein